MKYNYLSSCNNNILTKFWKYYYRLQREINNGNFNKLSIFRKKILLKKIKKFYSKLISIQPKSSIVFAYSGLLVALSASQLYAQFELNCEKNPFKGGENSCLVPFSSGNNTASPVFADINGDGNKDAIVGSKGTAEYFINIGTATEPNFNALTGTNNPFLVLKPSVTNHLSFADIDNDGDLDLLIGTREISGNGKKVQQLYYFKNIGDKTRPSFLEQTGTLNPIPNFEGTILTTIAYPNFVDIDNDGDQDIFVGMNSNTGTNTIFFENTGTTLNPVFIEKNGTNNPLSNGIGNSTITAIPTFVDIDNDGDYDAVISDDIGKFSFLKNTGTPTNPVFALQTGSENLFIEFDGYISASMGNSARYLNSNFADIDNDGDKDMIIGTLNGKVNYYKNYGTSTLASFDLSKAKEGVIISSNVTFADIDGDGDNDALFAGTYFEGLFYYKNIGTNTSPIYSTVEETNNPFYGLPIQYFFLAPTLADIDGDKDLDLIIGQYYLYSFMETSGIFQYFKNIGTITSPEFSLQVGTNNPLDKIDEGSLSKPTFIDLDSDGDLDFISARESYSYTGLDYYKNIGNSSNPIFIKQIGTNNPLPSSGACFAPIFVYFDGDDDMDLVVGTSSYYISQLRYFQNIGTPSFPILIELTGLNNPFNSIQQGSTFSPTFVDIENDGDLDLFVAKKGGAFAFYENTSIIKTTTIDNLPINSNNDLVSFPNPVNDQLSFSLNDAIGSNLNVTILDVTGTELLNKTYTNDGASMNLNVANLHPGVYVLKLSAEAKSSVVRFVKQ